MNRPASLAELFVAFTRLALQGFGGVLAVAQRELVERLNWLSEEEFVEMLAIAQVLPGPNVVNLSLMVGDRFFGTRGAMVALAGMLSVPAVIVLGPRRRLRPVVAAPRGRQCAARHGCRVCGLVLATGIKLLPALKQNPMGRATALGLALVALVLIGLLRWPLVAVLGVVGGGGMALAWRKLR